MNLYRQRKSIHFGPFFFRSPPWSKKGGRREEEAIVLRLPFRGNNFSTLSLHRLLRKAKKYIFPNKAKRVCVSFRLKTLNNGLIIRAGGTGNCEYANSKSGNRGGGFFMGNVFFFCEIRSSKCNISTILIPYKKNRLDRKRFAFYFIFSGV